MKHRSAKKYISILAVLLLVLAMMGAASAKSLYTLANIVGQQFDAWNVNPDGTITYQTSHNLSYAVEPVGIAVDADSGAIFITAERQNGFEMIDAVTMKSLGYVEAGFPFNLAGIDMDDKHNIIYTVQRSTAKVYAYDWDPNKIVINTSNPCCLDPGCSDPDCIITDGAVTLRAGYPKTLPNCVGVFGIALDERAKRLYIADSKAHMVRGYDMTTWGEVVSFTPSLIPAGIAVDRRRGFIYTVAPDFIPEDPSDPRSGECLPCVGDLFDPGFTLISKYDLDTGVETVMDIGHGGMGIAVEEITGYVYVSSGCSSDDISIWDTSTYPFTQLQTTGKIGNPTGVVAENVSYNPLDVNIPDEECMEAGEDGTYKICFDSTGIDFDITNVIIKDNLPAQTTFVSASDGGIYDPVAHAVTWNIGTLPGESPERCFQLVVHVDPLAPPMSKMVNYATITSNEIPPTTIVVERAVCCHYSSCPSSISVDMLPGECGAYVTWPIPTFKTCGQLILTSSAVYPDGSTRDNVNPGDFFPAECNGNPMGTDVTYIATDPSDPDGIILGICSFTVTVVDTEGPVVNGCPADITAGSTPGLQCGGLVDWTPPTFTDNCGQPTVTSTHNPGDFFSVGMSPTVTYTAVDSCGHTASCSFNVTVEDVTPPEARCKDITVQLDAYGNAGISAGDLDDGSTDNCGIADISVSPDSFTCANIGPTPVTLTVTDTSGNTDTCIATVTVEDITPPEAKCKDITVQLDATGNVSINAGDVDDGSTDICGIAGMSVSPETFICANIGANTVTLTVTDVVGNTDTCTATVTVEDVTPPEARCKDITVQLDAYGNVIISAGDVNDGSSDNCGIADISVSPDTFTCANIGPNPVTLTVTDTSGYIDTCTATVTVEDVTPPEAKCKDITVQLDTMGNVSISAGDVDDGSTDNCGIADISVSPDSFTCANIGPTPVTLTVTDTSGNTDTCIATVTVEDITPPEAKCKDITVQLDATGNVSIIGGDVDDGSTDNCGIANISVSPDTFTCANIGANPVTLTVTDIGGNTDTCTATVTVVDVTAPEAKCKDITVQLDAYGNVSIMAGDVDNASADNCGIADISVSPDTFTCVNIGPNPVTLTVTDTSGNTNTCIATVTIVDVTPPEAKCKDITVQLDAYGNASIIAGDVDDGSTDTCGITGISVSPNTFTCANIGTNPVTLTVTDTSGNTDTCTATVTVEDVTPPEAKCKDITVQLDTTGNFSISAVDVDNGSADNCGIAGISVSPDTFTCANIGANIVTLTVTDTSGNISTCTATVTVEDKGALALSNCPSDITVIADPGQCGANVSWTLPTFTGGCGPMTVTSDYNPGDFFPAECESTANGTLVTYTARNGYGNEVTCSFKVIVLDKEAPLVSGCPADITVNGVCGGSAASWTPPTFKGVCGPVSVTSTHNPGAVFPAGKTTVTYTATDSCGNTTTCTFVVTVEAGGAAPVTVNDCPADIILNNDPGECGAEVSWASPTFTGVCGPVTVTSTHNPDDFFPAECEATANGTVVTYTARDGYGNEATCSFKVVVLDKEAPLVSGCPADITVNDDSGQCGAIVSWTPPTFTDNCGPVTVTSDHNSGDFFLIGSTLVTYTALDGCGNMAQTCRFTVTVTGKGALKVDKCPPDITATNTPGKCDAPVFWIPPTFTGVCGPVTVTSDHNPGDIFPAECEATAQGTMVTYTATQVLPGNIVNTVTCSFRVVVLDKQAPMVSGCPPDITVNADPKECGAVVSWTPQKFVDNCGPVTVTTEAIYPDGSTHYGVKPGDFFPIGITVVIYTGTDDCGNATKCSFTITVSDQSAPLVTDCPADIIRNNDPHVCSAVVQWTPPVFTDNCGTVTVNSNHKPGDSFPAECETTAQGTVVTYTATDKYGNTANCSFRVIVLDKESPVVAIEKLENKYFSTDTISIHYTALDNCDPDPSVKVLLSNNGDAQVDITASSPISLNLAKLVGHNVIKITATDDCGNVGMASVEFDVVLKLVGRDQIMVKDEIQNMGITAFDAFIRFPAPYDALTIDKNTVSADGAPAMSMNRDWTLHQAICRFNRVDVTEVPEDDYFEVNGLFNYKGKICTFVGADYIYRVLPPPRTPVESPGQTPIEPPIQLRIKSPVEPQIQSPVEPTVKSPVKSTVEPPIQLTIQPPVEPQIKSPVEPTVKSPVKSTVEPPIHLQIQPPVEPQIQSPIEPTVKSPVKSTVEPPIHLQIQPLVEPQIQSPVQPTVKSPVKSLVKPIQVK